MGIGFPARRGCLQITSTIIKKAKHMNITLPWPPSALNPNARHAHWSVKAKAAKAYRTACKALAEAHGVVAPDSPKIALWVEFVPPDRRHRDDDNMVASFKAGRDGLADALGVDDRRFVCRHTVSDEVGGMVRVSITPEV